MLSTPKIHRAAKSKRLWIFRAASCYLGDQSFSPAAHEGVKSIHRHITRVREPILSMSSPDLCHESSLITSCNTPHLSLKSIESTEIHSTCSLCTSPTCMIALDSPIFPHPIPTISTLKRSFAVAWVLIQYLSRFIVRFPYCQEWDYKFFYYRSLEM